MRAAVAVALLALFAAPGAVVFGADLFGHGTKVDAWLEVRLGVSHRLASSLPATGTLFAVPPLIVLLHFLRLRRKAVVVPSTFLWHRSIEDLHVNRLMQWLRRNVLLLLQLLAAFLLIYAVLGPRLHGSNVAVGRHYVLLIDNSASMSATDVAPSRLAWAKAEALKEIDAATDADFGMVVTFNRTAEIRQSYTGNRALLRAAVEGVAPTACQTRIDEAMGLVASLANPAHSMENEAARPDNPEQSKARAYVAAEGPTTDVYLLSDGAFPPVPGFALERLNLTYRAPAVPSEGGTSNNLAIVRLDAARGWPQSAAERDRDDPTKLTVTATVRNYRAAAAERQVVRLDVLDGAGRTVGSYARTEAFAAKAAGPSAGQEVHFPLADAAETADAVFRVRLENTGDALALDDEAWLVPGTARKARMLVVGPPNDVLAKFLDAPSTRAIADVTRFGPEALSDKAKYLDPARDGRYDLVVFDRCAPATEDEMPRANASFIGHPPPPFRWPIPGRPDDALTVKPVSNPPVTGWSDSHPVMRGLRGLYEIEIDGAFHLPELPAKTARLIESDGNVTLLAAVPRGPFTDLVLAFPILADDGRWNTLWPLRLSFVPFLRNVIRYLGNVRDALADDPLRPGDVKVLRPLGPARVRVTTPAGRTVELDRGPRADAAFSDTGAVGVYAAAWGDEVQRFAVNLFDAEESDLVPRPSVSVGNRTVVAGADRSEPRELWKLAVLAGLAVLLAEWWLYTGRMRP